MTKRALSDSFQPELVSNKQARAAVLKLENDNVRFLGHCKKCGYALFEEICMETGIWCYNSQYHESPNPDFPEIVFCCISQEIPQYKCRSCATKRERYKHDRTF